MAYEIKKNRKEGIKMKNLFKKAKKKDKVIDMTKRLKTIMNVAVIVALVSVIVMLFVMIPKNNLMAMYITGWVFVPLGAISVVVLAMLLIGDSIIGADKKKRIERSGSIYLSCMGVIILLAGLFLFENITSYGEGNYKTKELAIEQIEKEIKKENKDYQLLVDFEGSPYKKEIRNMTNYVIDKNKLNDNVVKVGTMKNLIKDKVEELLKSNIEKDINMQEFIEYAGLKEKDLKQKTDAERLRELEKKYKKSTCCCGCKGSSNCCDNNASCSIK